jgi:hypothetical protein
MIEGKGSFNDFEEAVFDEIQRRHSARYDMPPLSFERETYPPQYKPVPREVTGIDVSRWLFRELRRRSGSGGTDCITVDYCDGNGPRAQWFGLVVNPVDTLEWMQAKLTPDE